MMVNVGKRVVSVNIAFSSSRNAALIERKVLQYTTLCINYHHCTLSERKTFLFTMSDVLACVSRYWADQKQHSIPVFFTKPNKNTLQTFVDVANESLQAYKTSANVENHLLFRRLHQCNWAGFLMFLFAFVLSN